jgi:hypothetical protein
MSRVDEITKEYANDPRSIILLVCGADNDYPARRSAEVISSIGRVRTMGILTKVDRADNSDRALVLYEEKAKIVCGLGWHFLTNWSNSDRVANMLFKKRDAKERDFRLRKAVAHSARQMCGESVNSESN